LRGLAEVSVQAAETARKILEFRGAHRRNITEHLGRAAGNRHRCLSGFTRGPILSVSDVRELLGATFAGANQIVQRLMDLKILAEITGQVRNRLFRYDAYVRLFDEEADALPSTLEELPTGARGVDRKHRRTHAGCTSQIPDLVQEVRIRLAAARFVRRRRIARCSVAPRQSSQDEEGEARGSG